MNSEWQPIGVSDNTYTFETRDGKIIDLADGAKIIFNNKPLSPYFVEWRTDPAGFAEVREAAKIGSEKKAYSRFFLALSGQEMSFLIAQKKSTFTKAAVMKEERKLQDALKPMRKFLAGNTP